MVGGVYRGEVGVFNQDLTRRKEPMCTPLRSTWEFGDVSSPVIYCQHFYVKLDDVSHSISRAA
jgi:hypothetical protein